MLKAENIHKSFEQLQVLKGVSLNVSQGEIVSIVGKSGAGKTTLLQILGTLDNPDKGRIQINDTDISQLRKNDLATFRNQHIGFVFQFHQLLPEFTALENVVIPALIGNRSRKYATKKAEDLLCYLGLSERLQHKPSELSGGEKQRVAVARALVNQPQLILADEPSGSLDSQNKQELHKLLLEVRDKFGLTIIIVTHDKELAQLSDRIITMKDGTIVVSSGIEPESKV